MKSCQELERFPKILEPCLTLTWSNFMIFYFIYTHLLALLMLQTFKQYKKNFITIEQNSDSLHRYDMKNLKEVLLDMPCCQVKRPILLVPKHQSFTKGNSLLLHLKLIMLSINLWGVFDQSNGWSISIPMGHLQVDK